MPEYSDDMNLVFHALADGTRRAMVERLTRGPASVSQLAETFAMALQSAVARLREWNNPPTESREGREVFYTYANSNPNCDSRYQFCLDQPID